jgi:hypothetical protein
MLKLIMLFKFKLRIKMFKSQNFSMAQMFKHNTCLDQIPNSNHGLRNQNQNQKILLLIHTQILMMEVYTIKKRFLHIFQKVLMIS